VTRYNNERLDNEIGYVTLSATMNGKTEEIWDKRQQGLKEALAARKKACLMYMK